MPDTDEYADVAAEQDPQSEKRSLGTLGAVLGIIVVIIIVLLLWRSCGTKASSVEGQPESGVITGVPGLERIDAGVAVWLKPGMDIDVVLERNGLSGAMYTDLGEGTYVIVVDQGEAAKAVARLKDDADLSDAGFIYTEPVE